MINFGWAYFFGTTGSKEGLYTQPVRLWVNLKIVYTHNSRGSTRGVVGELENLMPCTISVTPARQPFTRWGSNTALSSGSRPGWRKDKQIRCTSRCSQRLLIYRQVDRMRFLPYKAEGGTS